MAENDDSGEARLSREEFVRLGAAAALGVTAGPLLGFGDASSDALAAIGQKPTRGGRLRVGMITGGSAETIDPARAINTPDVCRVQQLFDPLYNVSPDLRNVPALAEEGVPNRDSSIWTLRLRRGVTFHGGKELSADDLIWTIGLWTNPSHFAYGLTGGLIDKRNVTKVDKYTVRVHLKVPNARFPDLLGNFNVGIVQAGTHGQSSIGTGPFQPVSFHPGSDSVFKRNPNYWAHGTPYVDELEVNTTFTDEDARFNALQSGQIDVTPVMPFLQAKTALKNGTPGVQVLRAAAPAFYAFYMRVDKPPFSDVRVRQAMRLLVDRQALVNEIFLGLGRPANDLAGVGTQFFAGDLRRDRDVAQAKSLLAKAGLRDLRVTLETSPAAAGFVQAAQLLQQQAKDAGVTINIQQRDPAQYFNPATLYLKMRFAQAIWFLVPNLQLWWSSTLTRHANSNETHWFNAQSDKLFAEANGTQDTHRAAALWRQLQLQQFNQGGYVIWGTPDLLDGLGTHVHGLRPSQYQYCGNWTFLNAWIGK